MSERINGSGPDDAGVGEQIFTEPMMISKIIDVLGVDLPVVARAVRRYESDNVIQPQGGFYSPWDANLIASWVCQLKIDEMIDREAERKRKKEEKKQHGVVVSRRLS